MTAPTSSTSTAKIFVAFVGGIPDGDNVDLMITGGLQLNGVKSLFATSATVKVHRESKKRHVAVAWHWRDATLKCTSAVVKMRGLAGGADAHVGSP